MARHTLLDTEKIEQTIKGLSQDSFTVLDFTAAFKELYPQDWTRLVERLGELGQGRRYTVNTYLSNRLDVYSHKPGSLLMPFLRYSEAKFADYRKPTVEERKRFWQPMDRRLQEEEDARGRRVLHVSKASVAGRVR